MPGATGRDIHIDKVLSNMAIGYKPEGFIASDVMPIVPVDKQSDIYAVFSRADRLRRQKTNRSPGTEARRIDESVGSGTFYCANYALKKPVTLEDKSNADPLYLQNLIEGRTELVLDGLLLDWEVRVATQVTNTANVGSSSAVSSAWNGAGDPLGDVNTGVDNVQDSTGMMPNRVTFGLSAWRSFRRDSNVRNLIFGNNNGGGYPSTAQVADLLGVEKVLVGGAFQNTGEEGQAEALSQIWDDNVLIAYVADRPNIERPSFAYAFRWTRPGLPNMTVERHPYDTRIKAEEVEAGYYQDEVVTGADYGFLIVGVNSSQ